MKKIAAVILVIFGLAAGGAVYAQVSDAAVTVTSYDSESVYFKDFDRLVLDFTITPDQADRLNTLTVGVSGTARENIEYHTLKLWADNTVPGFQGWGFDNELATASKISGSWVFTNVNFDFPNGEQRFFVSIESGTLIQDKIAQFLLQEGNDINLDGQWQSGETGIFLDSGVIEEISGAHYSRTINFDSRKIDNAAPRGFVDGLSVDETTEFIAPQTPIIFTGMSRERQGGFVKEVFFIADGVEAPASNTGTNFSTWEFAYTPADGETDVKFSVRFVDSTGRAWTTPSYNAHIDSRVADSNTSTLTSGRSSIKNDGVDAAIITVILRDSTSALLPDRDLTFMTDRSADQLSSTNVRTDEEGQASVVLTSTLSGTANISVMHNGTLVKNVAVQIISEEPEILPPPPPEPGLQAGDLIKGSQDAVYYYDSKGERHVFVFQAIYESWYGSDFSAVKTIDDSVLASIPLGGPVSYRPGTLLTAPSINEVYVVDAGQTLRHLTTEALAVAIFGNNWNQTVKDLPESLLFSYNFGEPIDSTEDFDPAAIAAQPFTIDQELVN